MTDVIILGGGIKGTALAALSTLAGFHVTLVERKRLASGATSRNHGRLHVGTASWKTDSLALMRRRYLGSRIIRSVLPGFPTDARASYCFADDQEGQAFEGRVTKAGIPVESCANFSDIENWIDVRKITSQYRVEEYAFDPALTARLLAGVALRNGAVFRFERAVEITHNLERFSIKLADGEYVSGDCVVNAMSAWADLVKVPADFRRASVQWHTWSLVCADRNEINAPELDRVVVVWPKEGPQISAIPHGHWVTLDNGSTPISTNESPEPASDWLGLSGDRSEDLTLFQPITEQLRPLHIADIDNCFKLTGVHARQRGTKPGSVHQLHQSGRYYLSFGGQASTALLDAVDTVDKIKHDIGDRAYRSTSELARLAEQLNDTSAVGGGSMRWLDEKL